MLSHSMNRRALLKGVVASSLLMLPGRGFGQAAMPTRGGHLRLAMAGGSTTDTLDPRTLTDRGGFMLSFVMRGALAEVSADNTLAPSLAESWEPNPGATVWAFNLRKGVSFHSGKDFLAEDVIASLNLHMGADTISGAKALLSGIQEMKADGPHRVIFTLSAGNADFPSVFVDPTMSMLPSKDGVADAAGMDGAGAYKLESFEPGVSARLVRNENFWNAGNAAFLDSAEILYVADTAARMNALRGGEVDVINSVDIKTAALLKRVPGVVVTEVESGQHTVFCMLTDQGPFADVNVRQALKYAINRQEFVEKILGGHGSLGNDTPIFKGMKYHASDIPQRQYDPEHAKFWLKKSGLGSIDLPLSVAETGFAGATDAGQLYVETAREAGINISLTREPNDGYWDNVWLKKPFCSSYWGHRLTEDAIFTIAYAKGAAYNETHWANERFNELLVSARAELDEARRGEMYGEMQRLVHDDGGAVVPAFMNHIWATSDKVQTIGKFGPNWDLDGLRGIERWWLTA